MRFSFFIWRLFPSPKWKYRWPELEHRSSYTFILMNHHLCFNSLTFVKLHLFAESLIFLPSWHPCVMFPADSQCQTAKTAAGSVNNFTREITSYLHNLCLLLPNVLIQLDENICRKTYYVCTFCSLYVFLYWLMKLSEPA